MTYHDPMTDLPIYRRPLVSRLIDLLTEDGPMRLVAVTGPRQTGKTTMVLQAREELKKSGLPCWYVAVDDPTPGEPPFDTAPTEAATLRPGRAPGPEWLVSTWNRARAAADRSPQGLVLALDEVQRIRNWSSIVKGLWDGDRRTGCRLRVVILGSAPWAMLTGMHESLAGRFDPFPVMHWSLEEMQRAFGVTLDEYIFFGGYPGAAIHIRDATRWRGHIRYAIMDPVIDRDILSLTRVEKPSLMRALMDLAPEYSGQVVSYRKLQGQLDDAGNTTTLARYLDLLADAGLITGLQKYSAKPYLSKRSTPEAERAEHRHHDRRIRLSLRARQRRWRLLGAAVRERRGSASAQHPPAGQDRQAPLLAGRSPGGRLRARIGPATARDRGEERSPGRSHGRPGGV